ncbi:hypothetical protein HZS_5114 [Henneguya salminicola]|nr:hypothetical protein HZS_5114 [Henneguya salminicola]
MKEYVSVIGDSFSNLEDSLKVILRIRPPFNNEIEDLNYFEVISANQLNVKVPEGSWTSKNMKRLNNESSFNFEFSNIYDWSASQEKIFCGLIDGVVLDFLSGRNGLLFTYGITNSGKTYTLIGKPKELGVLPRTIDYLFKCLEKYNIGNKPLYKRCPYRGVVESDLKQVESDLEIKKKLLEEEHGHKLNNNNCQENVFSPNKKEHEQDDFDCDAIDPKVVEQINLGIDVMDVPDGIDTAHYIYMSIAEIYNEQIFDLLDTSIFEHCTEFKRLSLKIQGDQKTGFFVKNLRSVLVCDRFEALKLLQIGLSNRRMAATRLNINSSRSHVIYTINLVRCTNLPNGIVGVKSNEISFVDLAGAERQSNTLSEGVRLTEASNINKSLLFLNRCIQEMRDYRLNSNKNSVVPYRESKLTQLLQPFFVGRARMILLVNISPSIRVFDDTISVLKFSAITKEVVLFALNRPIGIELQQAVKTDAVINDCSSVNLTQCTKSELIQIIYGLRRKVVDTNHSMDSYDVVLRGEMCEFTMSMLSEIQIERENEINLQRKLVAESYLVKIDLLKDDIAQLHQRLALSDSCNEHRLNNECDILKSELATKTELFHQLMIDVETFKNDSYKDINFLRNENKRLIQQEEEKSKDIFKLQTQNDTLKEKVTCYEGQAADFQATSKKARQLGMEISTLKNQEIKLTNEIQCLKTYMTKIPILVSKTIAEVKNLNLEQAKEFESCKKDVFESLKIVKYNLESMSTRYSYVLNQTIQTSNMSEKYSALKESIVNFNNKVSANYRKLLTHMSEVKDFVDHHFNQSLKKITHKTDLISKYILYVEKNNLESIRENQRLSKNLEERNSDYNQLHVQFEKITVELTNLHSNNTDLKNLNIEYIKTIEDLKAQSLELADKVKQKKMRCNKTMHEPCSNLQNELKSYKKLYEECQSHVEKLENLISERKILSSMPQNTTPTIIAPLKRQVSASHKENYENYILYQKQRILDKISTLCYKIL